MKQKKIKLQIKDNENKLNVRKSIESKRKNSNLHDDHWMTQPMIHWSCLKKNLIVSEN